MDDTIPQLLQALNRLGFNSDGATCTITETLITIVDIRTPPGIHLQTILAASLSTLEDQLQAIGEAMDQFPAYANQLACTTDPKAVANAVEFCNRQAARIRKERDTVFAANYSKQPHTQDTRKEYES